MKITDLIQDNKNANKGTQRGRDAVKASLERFGTGRSILLDKEGRIVAGNKTVEQAAEAGITDVVVVQTDGKQLIAVQRTDVSLDDKTGRGLAVADNRTSELGLDWDPVNLNDLCTDLDLKPFFTDSELSSLIAPDATPEPGSSSGEVDVDSFEFTHECPKCHFQFNDDK